MISQAFNERIHSDEKSDFALLCLYIEQEVSRISLQQLLEIIENSKDSEVTFIHLKYQSSIDVYY